MQPQIGWPSRQAQQHSAAKANPLFLDKGRASKHWQAKAQFQRYHQEKPDTQRDPSRELG